MWGIVHRRKRSCYRDRGSRFLPFDWGGAAVEFLRFVEKLNLDQLKRLVRSEMIVLNTLDRSRRVVRFDDRVTVFTLYLESHFITHDRNPICSNGTIEGWHVFNYPCVDESREAAAIDSDAMIGLGTRTIFAHGLPR